MCSIIWSETFIKTNVYKTNKIEKEYRMIKNYIKLLLNSMVPIEELRAAIAIIGNMIPVPFIYLFARKVLEIGNDMPGIIGKFCRWCTAKGEKGGEKLQATAGKGLFVALLLFVGIPLPGTGAWTGTLAASFLKMDFKSSAIAAMCGVLLAGVIMMTLSAGFFTLIR